MYSERLANISRQSAGFEIAWLLFRNDRHRHRLCELTTNKKSRPVQSDPYRSFLQPQDLRDLRSVEAFHVMENQDQSIARRYADDSLV